MELPEEQVRELVQVARRRRFSRNEVVFHRDDPGDSLHLIVSGRFAIRVMTSHRDTVTIAVRGAGQSFGEMALVGETSRRTATVAALEPAETFAVYRDDFEYLRKRHPGINAIAQLSHERGPRVERAPARGAVRAGREAPTTAAPRARGALPRSEGGHPLIPLTLETLAELAGASRPTVNQVLRDEESRGTIEHSRGTRILDVQELARRAR